METNIRRRREGGKAVRIDDIGVWYDAPSDRIHVTHREVRNFHVAVGPDAEKPNGHPALYRALAECLRLAGAPCPPDD